MADHSAEYVAVEVAGKLAGISPRTLRHWIAVGKLSAIAGKRGKLVSVEEVHALAVLTGKAPGNATGHGDSPATSAIGNAGTVAEDAQPQPGAVVVSPAASTQLAAIRDEWLAPLVAQIAEQAERIGRLEAERDAADREIADLGERLDLATATLERARERTERAEREREELRRRAEAAERECEEIQRRHDALRASAIFKGLPAATAATSEADEHEHDLGDLRPLGRVQRLWRAIRGGQP